MLGPPRSVRGLIVAYFVGRNSSRYAWKINDFRTIIAGVFWLLRRVMGSCPIPRRSVRTDHDDIRSQRQGRDRDGWKRGIGPGIAAAPADARATVVTAVDGGYSSRG
jgi:hypothetical protein